MPKLGPTLVDFASALPYRADAEQRVSWMPYTGVFWTDEIPGLRALAGAMSSEDRHQLFSLFDIRAQMWLGNEISAAEQELWDAARAQVPDYPLFHRLDVDEEVVALQRRLGREMDVACESLNREQFAKLSSGRDADVEPAAPAVKRPWWKRLLRLR